jgi:hypothetical protein
VRVLVALALSVVLPSVARGWPVGLGKAAASKLATDRGDVLAALLVPLPPYYQTCEVVKFGRVDGHVRWRHRINGDGRQQSTEIGDLIVTADGDAIFVGQVEDTDGEDFAVARLAAASGRERWRSSLRGRQPDGVYNAGRSAVVDPKGDVLVAGTLQDRPATATGQTADYGDFAVVKLDGGTGDERWRAVFPGPLIPLGNGGFSSQEADAEVVAVDTAGDAVAPGEFFGINASETVSVVKLSGATGQLLWRSDLDSAWRTSVPATPSWRSALQNSTATISAS